MTATATPTLADFLLARIEDDEAVARAAVEDADGDSEWRTGPRDALGNTPSVVQDLRDDPIPYTVASSLTNGDAAHIALHDPARVLAECAAKRAIVEQVEDGCPHGFDRGDGRRIYAGGWCIEHCDKILQSLAQPYASHPDFRAEWSA